MYTQHSLAQAPHPRRLPFHPLPLTTDSLKQLFSDCADFECRAVCLGLDPERTVTVCWLDGMVAGDLVAEDIIRPLTSAPRQRDAASPADALARVLSGAELAASLSRPFFVLVRTLVFFRTVERVEALVVMLWIFPDFLMAALYLWAGRQALGLLPAGKQLGPRRFGPAEDTARGLTWVCGAAVIGLGLVLAPDSGSLERWSRTLIPAINLVFSFGLLPFLYIIGSRRGEKES